MSGLTLRRLHGADAAALCEMELRGYKPTLSEDGYRHELDHNELARYWGLFDGAALAGYTGSWLIADEAHVSILVVEPDQRRRGLGEFLLLHLLLDACARGASLATLEVRRNNLPAQALYSRWGFVTIGERSRYYPDGEDGLVMLLEPLGDPNQQAQRIQRYAALLSDLAIAAPDRAT